MLDALPLMCVTIVEVHHLCPEQGAIYPKKPRVTRFVGRFPPSLGHVTDVIANNSEGRRPP